MKQSSEGEAKWVRQKVSRVIAETMPSRWRPESGTVWHPPTDVYETDDRVVVLVEIPGLEEGDYAVTLSNRILMVRGKRRDTVDKVAYHQMEIRYGEFRAQVFLPWPLTDAEQAVEASYKDGFLKVELQKAQLLRIPVKQRSDENDCEETA